MRLGRYVVWAVEVALAAMRYVVWVVGAAPATLRYLVWVAGVALATLSVLASEGSGQDPAAAAGSESLVLKPAFSHAVGAYSKPFAGHNGKHLLYSDGTRITGLDTQTSLVRWQGGELESVRQVVDLPGRIMLIGEHVQVIDKERGQRIWDFPLNCFSKDQCNADVLARTRDRLLVGGFGARYNMVQIVGIEDGKEIWPNWVTTCFISLAGIALDSVILVCSTDNPLIQRVELATRRTAYTTLTPAPGFKAEQAWYSDTYVYVVGALDEQKKLYVFGAEDGKVAGKFNIKSSGNEMGFVISPDAGRFVPWQDNGSERTFWGIDVATGKSAWQTKLPSGPIAGQVGSALAVLGSKDDTVSLLGLDLATGKQSFGFPLPFDHPVSTLIDKTLYVVERNGGRFLALDLATGGVTRLGTLPPNAAPTDETLYFASTDSGFVALAGNQVTLFQGTSIPAQVEQIVSKLDAGNEAAARDLYEALQPFKRTLPEAAKASREMARYRFLNARLKLRGKTPETGVEPLSVVLDDAPSWTDAELTEMLPDVERVALEFAMSGIRSEQLDEALLNALSLLAAHGEVVKGIASANLVETAVALASALADGSWKLKAAEQVGILEESKNTAAFFDGHPYRTAKEIETIQTTLELADQSYEEGDLAMAADLLKELASNVASERLFGQTYDPWLDAAGLYLLPPEDQQNKIPGVLKGLKSRFESGKKTIEREASRDICERACDLAADLCKTSNCVNPKDCPRSQDRCRSECGRSRMLWSPPSFNVAPTSTTFYKCR